MDGKLIYSGAGGYADIKNKIPTTPHSLFRVASVTKSFTAMAIVKLRDEGHLRLDDPISLYIPESKNWQLTQDAPAVTIRHLLTHGSGLPQDDPWGDRKLAASNEALVAILKSGPSASTPVGTAYEYSNLSFSILGYIIKQASGLSYQDYIAKNIWQPLGMTQVAWEFARVPPKELVHGYKWQYGRWQEEPLLHDGSFAAMGGMIASIDSFSRYVALHLSAWPARDDREEGPVKRRSLREMHHPWNFEDLVDYKLPDGSACALVKAYGYGLRWWRDCKTNVYIKHSGGLPGFGSNWTIMPEYGIGVILFANATYAPADDINFQVLNKLIEIAALKPRELPNSAILKERQAALIDCLPHWNQGINKTIFADNFFQDNSLKALQQETQRIFTHAGKIDRIGEMKALNQLRGHFLMYGEKADIEISFTLTPESPPLIQSFQIKEIEKSTKIA